MRRASTPWLLGLVLLASLGPTLALACKPVPQTPWTMRSANGRATLSMKGTGLTLRNARGKVLWKQDVRYLSREEASLSPSGRYVAVETSGSFVIYGPKGKPLGTWSILDALTQRERSRLPKSPCEDGPVGDAAFKGEVLEVKVDVTVLRIDPQTGTLTRQLPRNEPKLPELIQRWQSSPAGSERDETLEALSVRAIAASKPGALPELRSFWQELLTAPGLKPEERAAAVQGLGHIGTDEEIRALARYLGTEVGPLVLATFDARLPPAEVFEQVLPLCQDSDPALRHRTVEHLLSLLEARGPERKALLAALRRADTQGKLAPLPEGWIILGGLEDLAGKRARALKLYAQGVENLSSSGGAESRPPGSIELLSEALLQLAFEAKKQNKQDELAQRIHDVLSLPNAENTLVFAPKPNRYARADTSPSRKGLAQGKPVTMVVRELNARVVPTNQRPKSRTPYDPFKVGP